MALTLLFYRVVIPTRTEALPKRSDLHLARKTWHIVTGLAIVFTVTLSGMSRSAAVSVLGTILSFNLFVEYLRLRNPKVNEVALRFWKPLMRRGEESRLSGIPYYLAAAILVIGAFPEPVAMLSLLFLACGDPVASYFGIRFGSYSIRFPHGKTLVGTMSAVIVCSLITAIYLASYPAISGWDYVLVIIAGGFAGGIAEALPFEVDDNFTVPVVSGFILWITFILLGI